MSLTFLLRNFEQADNIDVKNFPRTIEGWTSQDIPLSKEDKAILETDNAFIRRYKNPKGQEVYLYIVYSQTNRKVSHPPEICYTGAGVSILENSLTRLSAGSETIEAKRLVLEANHASEISCYWFKIGNSFTASYWKQQVISAINALCGKKTGSALIRVSTPVIQGKQAQADQLLSQFVSSILPLLTQYLP